VGLFGFWYAMVDLWCETAPAVDHDYTVTVYLTLLVPLLGFGGWGVRRFSSEGCRFVKHVAWWPAAVVSAPATGLSSRL
jgi:hypothetical protein